ncbi:MAG: hypothetical protein WAN10_03870 [Candidatus Acidiferrales bacterium]
MKLQVKLEKAARKAVKKKAAADFAAGADASVLVSQTSNTGSGFLGMLVLGAICFGCWLWFWPKAWYEVKYQISADHVFIDPEPHDCDFMKAPLGNKYCHFEKIVTLSPENSANPTDVYVTWEKVED